MFAPGAFADHLTSFAGHFGTASQTKMSRWIAKGAVGSSGTVEEPCNYTGKFPHARTHYFYDQGATLGEAYLRGIGFVPFQVQFIGDPLARPYTHIPRVTIDGLGSSASGIESFSASATTTKPGATIDRFVLMANGVTLDEAGVSGAFQFDTTSLPDGVNEIRVVAYDDTLLESRGSATMMVTVDNRGRLPTLTPSAASGDLSTSLRFSVSAPGAEEVRLVRAGAVLGAVGGASGAISLFGMNLGEGPSTVWAEATYADGTIARSARQQVTINGSAFGAANAPVAFDYTRTIEAGQTVLVSLPAQVRGNPADVTFEVTQAPMGDAELLWFDGKGFALVRMGDDASIGDTLAYRVQTVAGSDTGVVTLALPVSGGCRADLDGDGRLTIFDFLAFQNLFDAGDPIADFDGDGSLTIFDFLAFQNEFDAGC